MELNEKKLFDCFHTKYRQTIPGLAFDFQHTFWNYVGKFYWLYLVGIVSFTENQMIQIEFPWIF